MWQYKLEDIFKYISMEDGLISINSLFNKTTSRPLMYAPPYQRKFFWNPIKSTNLIESIIQHGEVPPLMIFEKTDCMEVIDGRQRCQTIDLFLNNNLQLREAGLDNLWYLANKKFKDLDPKLVSRIKETKLRVIIIQLIDKENTPADIQDQITREIFKRYNLGMTSLNKEEVYLAQYLQDPLNNYFKRMLINSKELRHQLEHIFEHKKKNIEVLMQHIRQLLVQHQIPISRFVYDRDDIINKYYDLLSSKSISEQSIHRIFKDFKEKIYFLSEIKELLVNENINCNGLVFDAMYWALSVCEREKIRSDKFNNPIFKEKLVKYIKKNSIRLSHKYGNLSRHVMDRYICISNYFKSEIQISFDLYLKSSDKFIETTKKLIQEYNQKRVPVKNESEYFSKTQPTLSTIIDIIEDLKQYKFIIRPSYQRQELKNILKASSLIESILLGLKLHPIYIYLRADGSREVIDGQQRLLSIIAYMGEKYLDENNEMIECKKHCFELNLPSNTMGLHKKKYSDLPEHLRVRIQSFRLSIVEIKEIENPNFKPEELYKRLNRKPYPIKENSFEYWNAYADKDIITAIKEEFNNNKWFYLRIDDTRYLNEELFTVLAYLHYQLPSNISDMKSIKRLLSTHPMFDTLSIRFENKKDITKLLSKTSEKYNFIKSLKILEDEFLNKIKLLIATSIKGEPDRVPPKKVDSLLRTGPMRTTSNVFLIWIVLKGISTNYIKGNKEFVKKLLAQTLHSFKTCSTNEDFDKLIINTWEKAHPSTVL